MRASFVVGNISPSATGGGGGTIQLVHGQTQAFTGAPSVAANHLINDRGQDPVGSTNAGWAFARPHNTANPALAGQNQALPYTGPGANATIPVTPSGLTPRAFIGVCSDTSLGADSRVMQVSAQYTKASAPLPYWSVCTYLWKLGSGWLNNISGDGTFDGNMKPFVYTESGNGPFGTNVATDPFFYAGCHTDSGAPGIGSNTQLTWGGNYIVQQSGNGTIMPTLQGPPAVNWNGFANPENDSVGWVRWTRVIKWAADGTGTMLWYVNGQQLGSSQFNPLQYQGITTFGTPATSPNDRVNEAWGMCYTRNYNGTTGGTAPTQVVALADQTYWNGPSPARVELWDTTNPAATKLRILQTPVPGTANVVLDTEGFANGQTAFVMSVDESTNTLTQLQPGNTFVVQYPVVFDKFISSTGNDANAGTLASPWALTSLISGNANQAAMAGKKIGLIAGTYDCTGHNAGNDPTDYQSPVLNIPVGSSGNPTYIASCNTSGQYTRGASTITMGNTNVSTVTNHNSCIGQKSGSGGFFTLDGLVITAGNWQVGGTTNSSGSLIGYFPSGTAGPFTLQNCDLSGVAAGVPSGSNIACCFQQGAINSLIHNNNFHDTHKPIDPGHCHAFEEYSCNGTIFQFNTVQNCDGVSDGKLSVHNCTYRYNYFYNCQNSQGAIVGYDGGEDTTNSGANFFHHNVFDSCGMARAFDVGGPSPQPFNWYNNTTWDVRTGSTREFEGRTTSADAGLSQFYNNITVRTATGGGDSAGAMAFTTGGWAILNYNCYAFASLNAAWGVNYPSAAQTFSTLAAWRATSGTPDLNSFTAPATAAGVAFAGITLSPGTISPGAGPNQFKLNGGPCAGTGKVGGVSGGASQDMGAWGLDPALGTPPITIGCNFGPQD